MRFGVARKSAVAETRFIDAMKKKITEEEEKLTRNVGQ
jgi:hypothetical protein